MSDIKKLADILEAHDQEIKDYYEDARAVLLYGSFTFQNLQTSVKDFDSLKEKMAFLIKNQISLSLYLIWKKH